MEPRRTVVMGAGEVGCQLARTLSNESHRVTLIDNDPAQGAKVEDQLDVAFVLGNACHVPILREAGVEGCDLFVASSSSDEANLAASLLAKELGAARSVVRVNTTDDVTRFGPIYARSFKADLLLSTQLLTTTQVLNHVLGHNTLEVEYLAGGALQVRRIAIEAGSTLSDQALSEARLPVDCLVLALIRDGRISVPGGADRARVGDDALVIGTPESLDRLEQRSSGHARNLGRVVIAGGGDTAVAVVEALSTRARRVKLVERDRRRAEALAARFPAAEIVHGDATDMSLLTSEGIDRAQAFIALTGNDETNLMACLLAQELGAERLSALVQKSETSSLWRKVAVLDVVSPRRMAAERIRHYVENDYESHIVSFEGDAAAFVQRTVHPSSPVAGERLANVEIPRGLIVAALLRGGHASIPRGDVRLRVGDHVVLFVRRQEREVANLWFPGIDPEPTPS